jgi:multiple sugar transport system permease protein
LKKISYSKLVSYLILTIALLITIFPIYFLIVTSFKTFTEAFSYPPSLIPKNFTIEAYISVLNKWGFATFATNSIIITITSTLLSLALGVPMAYALARLKFGKNLNDTLAFTILSFRLLPPIVGIIPLFIVYSFLGLNDTYQGMILAYTSFNLPLVVWLIRGFIQELPKEIEEAALVDGASHYTILRKIILPLSLPAILTTGTLTIIQSWNEFIIAVFLTSKYRKTVPILLSSFIGDQQYFWNELTAASTIALIPVAILIAIVQRQLVRGLTFGAVKG